MTRFRVKVCGITRPQDATLAANLGADLVGVVFHPGSPRVVSVRKAEQILECVPAVVFRVGVFVDESASAVIKLAKRLHLNFIQLHGAQTNRDIQTIQQAGLNVIRALNGASPKAHQSAADIIMFDNMSADRPGGTGKTFTWPTRPQRKTPNLMLAGGLNEHNIVEGVRLFHPLIVDVNSGVESAPGIKSKTKLVRFMEVCDRIRYGK